MPDQDVSNLHVRTDRQRFGAVPWPPRPLPWIELRLGIADKVAIASLFLLYLAMVIGSLVISHRVQL
jgi:hypothetical protein